MEESQQQASNQEQVVNQPPVNNAPPVGVYPTASSDGPNGPFPQELNKFNWGAFLLTWIWSIGNSVWIGLLALISPISLIMMFVLGFKGNEWAWKAKKWESVEQFKAVQAKWQKWGIIIFVASIVLGVLMAVLVVFMSIVAVKNIQVNDYSVNGVPTTVDSVDY